MFVGVIKFVVINMMFIVIIVFINIFIVISLIEIFDSKITNVILFGRYVLVDAYPQDSSLH